MSDAVTLEIYNNINEIIVTEQSNNIIISSVGVQGPTGPQGISGTTPNLSTSSVLYASYTGQTNFNALTISGSSVATQAYVQANTPSIAASANYAFNSASLNGQPGSYYYPASSISNASVSYSASAGNANTTSQTNFSALTISGSNVATQSYVAGQGYLTSSGSIASASNSASLGGQPASYYAPISSPNFTGTPLAPTAASSTNNTQIATTQFVQSAVAGIINSAPSTLDTLNELATALGNDPNYATSTASLIGTKAPIASPTFTGTVNLGSNTATGSVSYATNAGNSTTTSQTNFSSLTISSSAVATQAYVTSLGYQTSSGSVSYATNAGNSASFGGQASSYYYPASSISNASVAYATSAGNSSSTSQTLFPILTSNSASFISTSSVSVPFTVKAAVSQSANLQEWQGSGGTALSYVRNDGMISAGGSGILTGTIRPPAFSSGGRINLADANPIIIDTSASTIVPLVAKGASGQSANLQQWQNSAGAVQAYVSNTGLGSFSQLMLPVASQISNNVDSGQGYLRFRSTGPIFTQGTAANVGLVIQGASSQSANLQEWQNSSGTILSRVKSDGTLQIGTETITTREYVQSRGMNLVTNGTGGLGTNYNFTSASTLFTDVPAGTKLSYYSASGVQGAVATDELIPVDPNKTYRGTISVKQLGTASNSNFYAYAAMYDIDSNGIFPATSYINPSTQTTLAQNLNVGDTVVYLTSTTNWTTVNGYLAVYGYKNSYGYQYPDYTYTQRYKQISIITASNNSITLSSAWSGASAAAGTAAANTLAAGTYKYFIISAAIPSSSSWTTYVGEIGGISSTNGWETNKFSAATAFIKIGWLSNYAPSTASSFMAVAGISLSEVSTGNLKVFDAKLTGDYSASWFQVKDSSRLNVPTLNVDLTNSRVGINISSPSAALHSVAYSSTEIPLIVQGATSQSVNLQEWKNSSASVLASVNASGGANFTAASVGGNRIVNTSDKLSALAATTSSELANIISDETGSGSLVFSGGPTFTGTVNGSALTLSGALTASTGTTTLGTTNVGAFTATSGSIGSAVIATQSFVSTSYAPLASPSFTGTVNLGSNTATGSVSYALNSASLGGVVASSYAQLASSNFTAASVGGNQVYTKTTSPYQTIPFSVTGTPTAQLYTQRLYNDTGSTRYITSVRANIGASATASTSIDVLKSGTSIFSSSAARPVISASGYTSGLVSASISGSAVATTDYLQVQVISVGTGASDLTIQVMWS